MRKNTVLKEVSKMATQKTDFPKKIAKFTSANKAENNNTPARKRFDDLCPLLKTSIRKESVIPKMEIYIISEPKNIGLNDM